MTGKNDNEQFPQDQTKDSLYETLGTLRSVNENYHKNILYITPEQQTKMKDVTILFAGVGLGSIIAEAALRIGFEKFILIDGDEVERSNLNRQNYHLQNIGVPKVEAIKQRLITINPKAQIETHHLFLNPENITSYIKNCDIAINAIDFDVTANSLDFDKICQENQVPIVHPFNFGWAGAAYVITPETQRMPINNENNQRYELTLIREFIDKHQNQPNINLDWFEDFLTSYTKFSTIISPPQLAVGSYLAAAIVTDILFAIVNNMHVKTFPEPYFLTTRLM